MVQSPLNKDVTIYRRLPLSLLLAMPSLSFSLKVSGTWEWEVGACSCWTQDHMRELHLQEVNFRPFGLPGVVRNVVCGFWIFTINWKESALKQLALWLLEGQAHICMLEMSLVQFRPLPFEDAEHQKSYLCLFLSRLRTGTITRCPLLVWLPVHYTSSSIFGFCNLLLSLSLCCKWCRKQMLDKILKLLSDCFSFQW